MDKEMKKRLGEYEKRKILSGVLHHLTAETMNHRAYSVEEILDDGVTIMPLFIKSGFLMLGG